MVTTNLNLSMNNPEVVQIHAKQGDSGRLYKVNLKDATEENGTLRILRPDGVEVTADAIKSAGGDAYKGDLVTFDALEEVPLTKCEVTLESSQDLHGQSSPYPSGGGKNKLSPSLANRTSSDVVFKPTSDDKISIKGLASSSAYSGGNYITYNDCPIKLPSGTYTFSSQGLIGTDNKQRIYIGIRKSSDDSLVEPLPLTFGDQTATFTVNENFGLFYWIYCKQGVNYDSIVSLQLELGSSATTWSPYSNICPIYPSNGKNLIDADTVWSAFLQDDGTFVNPLGTTHYSIPQSLVGKELTFSAKAKANSSSANCRVVAYVNGTNQNGTLINTTGIFSISSVTFTPTSTNDYLLFNSSGDNGTYKEIQLELGASVSPYVPYQGINVEQMGANFLNCDDAVAVGSGTTLTKTNGSIKIVNTNSIRYSGFTFWREGILAREVLPISTYTLSFDVSGTLTTSWASGLRRTTDNVFVTGSSINFSEAGHYSVTFDMSDLATDCYISFSRTGNSTSNIDATFTNIMLTKNSIEDAFEPYNGTTYPLSLGRSVYGGKVDLVSGKLVVDKYFTQISGGATKYTNANGYYWYTTLSGISAPSIKDLNEGLISNKFVAWANTTADTKDGVMTIYANGIVRWKEQGSMSQDDYRTWLGTNPVEICYDLAEPIEYDLTPTQISTLLGENNVWSSGEVEVAFEYDGLLAELPQQATAVVGRCLGDVNFTNVSTMPFTLNVIPNNQEETP